MSASISFPDLISSLADLGRVVRESPELQARIRPLVEELRAVGDTQIRVISWSLSPHPTAVILRPDAL